MEVTGCEHRKKFHLVPWHMKHLGKCTTCLRVEDSKEKNNTERKSMVQIDRAIVRPTWREACKPVVCTCHPEKVFKTLLEGSPLFICLWLNIVVLHYCFVCDVNFCLYTYKTCIVVSNCPLSVIVQPFCTIFHLLRQHIFSGFEPSLAALRVYIQLLSCTAETPVSRRKAPTLLTSLPPLNTVLTLVTDFP